MVSFKRFSLQDKYIWVLQDTMGCEKRGAHKLWPFIAELYLSMLVALLKQWTGTRLPLSFTIDSERPRNVQDFETYLRPVDLCCTHFAQQYIGSHIIENASDTILA